jgi:integrase
LTDKDVRSKKVAGYYPDGKNLYLQVGKSGGKSWIFRYSLSGKSREMGLGAYPTFTLAEARGRANDCRQLLTDGIDPLTDKVAKKTAQRLQDASVITFENAAERYIAKESPSWTNAKHAQQWRNTLVTYAFPVLGKMPVHTIDNKMIVAVLEPIWIGKRETADRVRQRIGKVLDWAKSMGYRTGDNPAVLQGNLENLLASTKAVIEHHPALSFAEIGVFMEELANRHAMSGLALQFLILTATRVGETLGARWTEIDEAAKVWIIPAERMKAKKEHAVPLSDAALAILKKAKAEMCDSEFVFADAKGKQLSTGAFTALLKRMERGDITTHGFRSTFRDWAAEVAHTPNEVAEMALAHQVKDKTEAAYRRGDLFAKRAKLMSDWAAYCALMPSADGENVIQLRGVA